MSELKFSSGGYELDRPEPSELSKVKLGKMAIAKFFRGLKDRFKSESQLRAEGEEIRDWGETMLEERPRQEEPALPAYDKNPGLDSKHPHIIPGQE